MISTKKELFGDVRFQIISTENSGRMIFKLSHLSFKIKFWAAGATPILKKDAPRMQGQMKMFHVGSHQFPGIAAGVAPRTVIFALLTS